MEGHPAGVRGLGDWLVQDKTPDAGCRCVMEKHIKEGSESGLLRLQMRPDYHRISASQSPYLPSLCLTESVSNSQVCLSLFSFILNSVKTKKEREREMEKEREMIAEALLQLEPSRICSEPTELPGPASVCPQSQQFQFGWECNPLFLSRP